MDVAAIERATVSAVAPEAVAEFPGWLAAMDSGSIRRACSAVPLDHNLTGDPTVLDQIEATYALRGLRPAFRIADAPGLAGLRAELERRGFGFEQPTLVKHGSVTAMLAAARGEPGEMIASPDAAWAAVFTGEGFDPVDGANRVRALSRSPGAVYGRVRDGERTLAVGVMSFGEGWASIHGMRTAPDRRGEGAAGRVLAALAEAARARGIEQVFLQVTEENPARSLYRRFGFERAWRYFYWSKV